GLPTERAAVQPGSRSGHQSGTGGEGQHNILAYADDLIPLANNPGTLQLRINLVAALSSRLGLRLNQAKCRTLHLSGQYPVGTRPTRRLIERELVPIIGDFVVHSFLGRPVGYRVLHDEATISDAVNLGKRLLNSVLAP
ncbi:unnamed protein product, partial [Ixodes pacificus]